jgi:hypothetical protein
MTAATATATLDAAIKELVDLLVPPTATRAANGAVYRTFTREQSSAIHNLHIEAEFVEVIFQSNPSKAYGFDSNREFTSKLIDAISWSDLPYSIGKMITQGRKSGDLMPIPAVE